MHTERLGEALGAEICGVDLSHPLSDDAFAEVAKAFFEHEVVVFRDQRLTPEQQIAFTRRFGELEHHVRRESCLPGFPEILIVSNLLDERGRAIGAQDAGRFWHSDLSYKREPSLLSALYALEVPTTSEGRVLGDTGFASATAAYAALPQAMKERLQGLRNVHSYRYYRAKNARAQGQDAARGRVVQEHVPSQAQLAGVPDVEMPVVRTHPVTGRKALFVNEAHTSRIVGLPAAQGDALLDELYRHIVRPEFVYTHRWRAGDLLMWDNCAVQHKATFDYALPLRRRMHRTTVRGPAPL